VKEADRPDVEQVLDSLKDFQRDSAAYAFRRLYEDRDTSHRFLVADEVGLGKTLVARGIIAMTIDHLWETTDRIDVLYICSNSDIARQNLRRLNVLGQEIAPPDRITMLPRHVKVLQGNKVNLIPLTPGTSFSLRSSEGRWEERVLLYWMLRQAWTLGNRASPKNLFQGWVTDATWFRERLRAAPKEYQIDEDLMANFAHSLELRVRSEQAEGRPDLRSRFDEVVERFGRIRKHIPKRDRALRSEVIGELRGVLAVSCLEALEPDLIILDEFQRFKELLNPETESGTLARGLFEYQHEATRARVLLLSATPYKMYTLAHEHGEDHYRDFVETLRFLTDGDTAQAEKLLRDYRDQMLRLEGGGTSLAKVRDALEAELRRVMIRTERLAATEDRDGMLQEIQPDGGPHLHTSDVRAYLNVQRVAKWVDHADATEYWKASPYLLSFMETYQLKAEVKRRLADPDWTREARRVLLGEGLGLRWEQVEAYEEIDPANPRLRILLDHMIGSGAWRLLWIPPSLPYYEPFGAYADPRLRVFTKRLVFGSWVVVPKMLTCLLSYEAERHMIRMLESSPVNTQDARSARRQLLTFTFSQGRLTGMPVLGMLYPSAALARFGDPLKLARLGERPPSRDEIVDRAEAAIAEELRNLVASAPTSGMEDERWYWAAPILLDLQVDRSATEAWLGERSLAVLWAGGQEDEEEGSRWAAHVATAQEMTVVPPTLGRPPGDLTRVLAEMAIGGPGTCALRALARAAGDSAVMREPWAKRAAAVVSWAFRRVFNLPEVTALIRGNNRTEPYWRRVVEHCVDGNLQAVLDEYAHVLQESLGLQTRPRDEVVAEIAATMVRALSLRTPTLRVDEIRDAQQTAVFEPRGMRGRFALRFQSEESESGRTTRPEQVREAFNSPFWPFVLATTSVGQEGLDFHQYCHAVVHWNLPSNPVDLEQREGRVHRYKGHAVRKNVAQGFRDAAFFTEDDPWEALFAAAEAVRPESVSEIFPFWVYAPAGGARIERHVPFLPLSRDRLRLEALRRSLAVYRMVFGQPRQDDLLGYLMTQLPPGRIDALVRETRIDLSPPRSPTPRVVAPSKT
jgi:Helicase conserved C-terminal domain